MKTGDWQRWVVGGIFFALLPLSSGCIDDNMSDCNNFTVRYRIELSTHTHFRVEWRISICIFMTVTNRSLIMSM